MKSDYQQLIEQIAELEPRSGSFATVDYLPNLTDGDIADCIDHNHDILDQFLGGNGASILAKFYREKGGDLMCAAMNLIRELDKTVLPNARRQVLNDVNEEIEARATL